MSNGPCGSSNSVWIVWCQRSIFPVVVGERIFVNRWSMPLRRQITSNSTSGARGRNLLVNCTPLSVSTCSGTPNRLSAASNARQTAREVARSTTDAMTQ